MRILLHIGQSKTGSSAIQAYLTLNRERLYREGIVYSGVSISGFTVDFGNHNIVADAPTGLLRYPYLTADQYFEQFYCHAKRIGAERLILSAEHFFGGEPRVWNVPDEKSYFERYREKVDSLAQYVSGHEVTLFLYLRPQIEWLASAISQTVRIERLISPGKPIYHDDEQFFELVKPLLGYCTLLDLWTDSLRPHDVIIVPYMRKNLRDQSTIADFLYRANVEGFTFPYGSEGVRVNTSLSREYIEVKKILNRTFKSETEEQTIIACLERLSSRKDRFVPYRLSDDLSQKVEAIVMAENTKLNEHYIKDAPQMKARDPESQSHYPETMGKKDIAAAMAEFKREYARPATRLRMLDYAIRAGLREHARPVQSVLHQLKRA